MRIAAFCVGGLAFAQAAEYQKGLPGPAHPFRPGLRGHRLSAAPTVFRWKWLLCLGAAVLLFAAARHFHVQDPLKQGLDSVGRMGPWGPAIFLAIDRAVAAEGWKVVFLT